MKITVKGIEQAKAIFTQRIANINTLRTPLGDIATGRDGFYQAEREWFDSEGSGRWKPLSPWYAQLKAQQYPGKRILRRTDSMYNQFTGVTKNYRVTGSTLEIRVTGKASEYWLKHQQGDPTTNLPRREVISPYLPGKFAAWHQKITDWLCK